MSAPTWLQIGSELISLAASTVKRIAVTDQSSLNFKFSDGTEFSYPFADSASAQAQFTSLATSLGAVASTGVSITGVSVTSMSISATLSFFLLGINFDPSVVVNLDYFNGSGFQQQNACSTTFINSTMLFVQVTGNFNTMSLPGYFIAVYADVNVSNINSPQIPAVA